MTGIYAPNIDVTTAWMATKRLECMPQTLKTLMSIGFVDVTTASLPSETDIYESPDFAFSFPL